MKKRGFDWIWKKGIMTEGLKTIITNTILGVKKVVRFPKKEHNLLTTRM